MDLLGTCQPGIPRLRSPRHTLWRAVLLALACLLLPGMAHGQDQQPIPLSIDAGVAGQKVRIAAANFKAGAGGSGALRGTFDKVLFNDLTNAGIFDVVSKSMIPQSTPGAQSEINLANWIAQPSNASYVAFGTFNQQGGQLVVNGILDDAHNTANPQIFGQQYTGEASEEEARQIAHKFADQIILRLGATNGIAETKIYYVHLAGGAKEIWEMDYDGADQHQVTHLGGIALSPRVSPNNDRLAFAELGKNGWQIQMYSLLLGRLVAFPIAPGTNVSPAWSPDGRQLAYSSSRTGDPEIWVSDVSGSLARRITSFAGPDVSPVYNPRSGGQIAWISGRTGLPQLYIMESDGSSVQRLTDGGYVSSPSWSPNGQFVAFGWNRKYGPGAPGGQDIYVMEIATKRWIQLTNGIGPCDFPSWSPDGRHLVFANSPDGRIEHTRIMSMLVDGTQRQALTGTGSDMPNWSFK